MEEGKKLEEVKRKVGGKGGKKGGKRERMQVEFEVSRLPHSVRGTRRTCTFGIRQLLKGFEQSGP